MNNDEIVELPDFEYTAEGLKKLKDILKSGKMVRNPFAQFYNDKIEVNIIQNVSAVAETSETSYRGV